MLTGHVIPIVLRPVDWQTAPFGNLLCLLHNTKPVTIWKNLDEAFLDVAKDLRTAISSLRNSPQLRTSSSALWGVFRRHYHFGGVSENPHGFCGPDQAKRVDERNRAQRPVIPGSSEWRAALWQEEIGEKITLLGGDEQDKPREVIPPFLALQRPPGKNEQGTIESADPKKPVLDPPVWPKTPEPLPTAAPTTPIGKPTCHVDVACMSLCCLLLSGILSSEAQQPLPLKKGKKRGEQISH